MTKSVRTITFIFYIAYISGCEEAVGINPKLLDSIIVKCNSNEPAGYSKNSEQYKKLDSWLSQNKLGWKESPVSYFPEVVIESGEVHFNLVRDLVVINYQLKQFVKELDDRSLVNSLCGGP